MKANARVMMALALLSVALVWARFNEFAVGSMGDDAVYVELARSISEGKGPVLHYGPDVGTSAAHGHPSGYPLLISPLAYFFPKSLTALKLGSVLFCFSFVALYLRMLTAVMASREVVALAALVLLNPWTIAYANRAFSESAYLCVSFGVVMLYDRWLRAKPFTVYLVTLAISLSLVVAIRSIGFSLLLAVALHLLYQRQWRRLGVWAVVQTLSLLLIMSFSRAGGGGIVPKAYENQLVGFDTNLLDRFAFMAWTLFYYLKELAALTLPVFGQAADTIATDMGWGGFYAGIVWTSGALVLFSSFAGGLSAQWRTAPGIQLLFVYLVLFLGVLCNWSFIPVERPGGWVELRLLLPLLPLFYLFGHRGLQMLAARVGIGTGLVTVLVLAVALPLSLAHNAYRIMVPFRDATTAAGRGFIDFEHGSEWLRENTAESDVIMTSSRLERHIHHNRPTIGYENFDTADWTEVQYVFIGPNDPDQPHVLDPTSAQMLKRVEGQVDRFRLARADSSEGWFIFRVI